MCKSINRSTFNDILNGEIVRHGSCTAALYGNRIVLRDLGSGDGSLVNGEAVRDAVLSPGDQIVFDLHHRFVLEAPAVATPLPPKPVEDPDGIELPLAPPRRRGPRLPWLLLAALMLAGAISALLLLGGD